MSENNENGKSISLTELLIVARTSIIWIIAIILICCIIGGTYAVFIKPATYTARVSVYVHAPSVDEDGNKISIAEHTLYQYSALIATEYEKVLVTKEMQKKLSEENGVEINYKGLKFVYSEGSAFFDITYTYSVHGGNVNEIKDKVSNDLNSYVDNAIVRLDDKNAEDKYVYGVLSNKLVVISHADVNSVEYSRGRVKTVAIFFAIGVVLACIFVVLRYFIDDTIKTKEDVERLMAVAVIAQVDISSNNVDPIVRVGEKE